MLPPRPTAWYLSDAWLGQSNFVLLHLAERRPSVKRPLTLGKELGYVSNDTLFPHFLWHALTQTSTNGEAMTDWAIWGTVARSRFHGTGSRAVRFRGSTETPSLRSAKLQTQSERGPHRRLPSRLHQANGARGQFYIEIIWRWEGFDNDPLQLPSSPHVSHFNLIINIWTGISWNPQKEKSHAGINNASTKGK